ncbi:MAG: glycosyltransferase family 4 protein [Thermoplasmata archaeon]
MGLGTSPAKPPSSVPVSKVGERDRHPRQVVVLCYDDPLNPKSGGAPKYCFEMARRLVRRGYHVSWLAGRFPGGSDHDVVEGVEFRRIGSEYTTFVRGALKLRDEFAKSIVFESVSAVPYFVPIMAEGPSVSIVHHVVPMNTLLRKTGMWAPFIYLTQNLLAPRLYRSRSVVTGSQSTSDELRRLGYSNVRVVREGVDIPPDSACSIDDKEDFVVVTGPLRPWKRIEDCLTAFAGLPLNWRLVVIGPHDEEDYLRSLHQQSISLGISERTTFTGRISEAAKNNWYRKASVALVASEKEGWGLCAVEPQIYRCPVVAYDVPGIRDSVRHGESGILVKNGDVRSLQRALVGLANNRDERQRMGERGRRLYLGYSWDNVFEDFYAVFQRIARPQGTVGSLDRWGEQEEPRPGRGHAPPHS